MDDLPPLYPGTPMLMSSVHPRTKKHVGDRLAAAAWAVAYNHDEKPATGPVLAGCRLEGKRLILSYNTSLLKDDTVSAIVGDISLQGHLSLLEYNRLIAFSGTQVLFKGYNRTNQASAMQVLIGAPFPRAYAESNTHVGPKIYDYPPWQYVDISVSVDISWLNLGRVHCSSPCSTKHLCLDPSNFWSKTRSLLQHKHSILRQAGPTPNTIAVELEGLFAGKSSSLGNGTITGVRTKSLLNLRCHCCCVTYSGGMVASRYGMLGGLKSLTRSVVGTSISRSLLALRIAALSQGLSRTCQQCHSRQRSQRMENASALHRRLATLDGENGGKL